MWKMRELSGANHRENRHGLCSAVHPRAPALAEQQQDGRNQRTGVTDTDPPNEVGDVPCPVDGTVQRPIRRYLSKRSRQWQKYTRPRKAEATRKAMIHSLEGRFFSGRAQILRDVVVGFVAFNQVRAEQALLVETYFI
jgi:hypothetical protein